VKWGRCRMKAAPGSEMYLVTAGISVELGSAFAQDSPIFANLNLELWFEPRFGRFKKANRGQ